MKHAHKYFAEFLGTLVLTLFGCGAAVVAGESLGVLGIALAFGLSIVAMAYVIGNISGCHLNPAVSFALLLDRKLPPIDALCYIVCQIVGAIAGSLILAFICGSTESLGANAVSASYPLHAGFITELILTFVFVFTVLGVTSDAKYESVSGIVIGLCLTFVHILGINITGTSVNPARSIGPAILQGGEALGQLWIFIAAPIVGSALALFAWQWVRYTRRGK